MMITVVTLQIIAYGALLAIGFAIGKEITKLFAEIWLRSKEKAIEWNLKRHHGILPDLGLAS